MVKKNKALTYVLIVVVLLVWGVIIYRIVIAYSGGHDESYVPPPAPKEVFNDYAVPKDTARLLLNYRDPFGIVVKKDTAKPPARNRLNAGIARLNMAPSFNWDIIRYSGYIKNPGSKKLIAFMKVNGKEAMMSEGETVGQFKLIRNMKDSVLVKSGGKTKYIHIQPAI
jgi:hypothetical protein